MLTLTPSQSLTPTVSLTLTLTLSLTLTLNCRPASTQARFIPFAGSTLLAAILNYAGEATEAGEPGGRNGRLAVRRA